MANKKRWFDLVKRLFVTDSCSRTEKGRKRRWMLGRLAMKSPPRERDRIREAKEEQSKPAEKIQEAVAAAAAAAPEVVHISSTSPPAAFPSIESDQFSAIGNEQIAFLSPDQLETRRIQHLAATKIQCAFKGYLARKALRALRGLVRIQAIIRGRAVRRQAITTLKCLQSVVNIQSKICARRVQMIEGPLPCQEHEESQDLRTKEIKVDLNSQRRWDDSLLLKEDSNAMYLSKRDALVKRDRIREYSSNQRISTESEHSKVTSGRWRYWLEQRLDEAQLDKKEDHDIQNPEPVSTSSSRIRETFRGRQIRTRNSQKQHYYLEPRRSFHYRRQRSMGDDNATGSVLPTYMAATESAKAKSRSLSSPRLRPINLDACSEINSPCKLRHKLSPISSINSEITTCSSIRIGNTNNGFQQRSPCLKGHHHHHHQAAPVKSNRPLKDFSFDSEECSLSVNL